MKNRIEKEIIKKWILNAYKKRMHDHSNHFWIIEDKLIGLDPSNEDLKKAYEFVKTFDDTFEVHQILNYLLGEIKVENAK